MKKKANRLFGALMVAGRATFVLIFGTILHQSTLGDQLPVGASLALLLTMLVAMEIRISSDSRTDGLFFALLLAVMLFVIGQDFWEDKMLPSNQNGLIWSFGAPLIAFAITAWPRLSKDQWANRARQP
ncbi:MAG: hypothetical protein WBH43_02535 [Aquiluna sp.]